MVNLENMQDIKTVEEIRLEGDKSVYILNMCERSGTCSITRHCNNCWADKYCKDYVGINREIKQ